MDSIWIILDFYCKVCAFRIILAYVACFNFFYARTNKPNIHNNTDISSFKNGLNELFSLTGFFVESKVIEGSHKGKNDDFFILGHFFSKCIFLRLWHFFSRLVVIQSTQFFSGTFSIAFIMFFYEIFFFFNYQNTYDAFQGGDILRGALTH